MEWSLHKGKRFSEFKVRMALTIYYTAFHPAYFTRSCEKGPGARFSIVPKTFRARKAICKSANRLSRKADLLRYFQGNKNKLNVKFDDLNLLRSWDTEGIVTSENGP